MHEPTRFKQTNIVCLHLLVRAEGIENDSSEGPFQNLLSCELVHFDGTVEFVGSIKIIKVGSQQYQLPTITNSQPSGFGNFS